MFDLQSDYAKIIEQTGAPHATGDEFLGLDQVRSNDKKAEELSKAMFAKD